jgi:hypothetical protein
VLVDDALEELGAEVCVQLLRFGEADEPVEQGGALPVRRGAEHQLYRLRLLVEERAPVPERGQLGERFEPAARLRHVLLGLGFGRLVAPQLFVEPREREGHSRLFRKTPTQLRQAVARLSYGVGHARLRAEELDPRVERRVNKPPDLVARARVRFAFVGGRRPRPDAEGETRRDRYREQRSSENFRPCLSQRSIRD